MNMGSGAELSAHSSYCCRQGCMGQMDKCWTTQAPARPADRDCLCTTASPHLPCLSSRRPQDTLGRMQEENMCLTVRTHEQHHKCEQLKVSRIPGRAWAETRLGLRAYRDSWAPAACPGHGLWENWLCRSMGQEQVVFAL